MYFIFITLVSGTVYLWRVSLWEFFSGGPGHIFLSAWGSAVWSVGPVHFIWVLAGVDGGTVQVFFW